MRSRRPRTDVVRSCVRVRGWEWGRWLRQTPSLSRAEKIRHTLGQRGQPATHADRPTGQAQRRGGPCGLHGRSPRYQAFAQAGTSGFSSEHRGADSFDRPYSVRRVVHVKYSTYGNQMTLTNRDIRLGNSHQSADADEARLPRLVRDGGAEWIQYGPSMRVVS